MMPYLRIERFKCFEDIMITFGKITLLAGINGAGKSTIIQALLLLRQAYVLGKLQNNELPLNGDIIKIGTARDALFRGSQEDSIAFTTCFGESHEETCNWVFKYEKHDQYVMHSDSSNRDLAVSGVFAPKFYYLTAERIGPRLTYPMSELPDKEMHVGFQGEYTPHILAKFGYDHIPNSNLALKSEDGNINFSLAHQAQLWMQHVSPYVTFNAETITKADHVLFGIRLYGEQTGYLRPPNMGFGICYTLSVVVAALMAEPGSMLILENPEAHLHPAGQSQLAQFLARVALGGVQVIVETHSDHILNGLRISVKKEIIDNNDAEIQFISRSKELGSNRVEKLQIYKDGGIDRWPEEFFDQMEKDLEKLF